MGTIRETFVLEDRFTPAFQNIVESMAAGVQLARQMTSSSDALAKEFAKSSTAGDKMANSVGKMENQMSRADVSGRGLLSTIKSLAGATLGFVSIKSFFGLSDELTQTNARLQLMTGSAENAAAAQDEIYAAAMRSRGAFTDMADTVAKLGTLAGNAFADTGEIIDFVEQLNKQMTLSGTGTAAGQAAMLQLTQGLASGVLRGEELNSVLENTPMIAQTIAEYMGVSTGVMREMASEGAVTAEVVKNAMLGAAEETNAKFEQIPMTWAQAWTMAKNAATQALEPVLDLVNLAANNLDTVIPVLSGLASGMLFFAAATSIANGSLAAMFATIAANPIIFTVAVGLGAIVYLIAQWVQSVGSLQVAWLMFKNVALTAGEEIYMGMRTVAVGIFDAFGSMVANLAEIAESFVNMWITAANFVIKAINLIPGNNIPLINEATFGSTAMASYQQAYQERHDSLASMRSDYDMRQMQRAQEIARAQEDATSVISSGTGSSTFASVPTYDQVGGIADSVSSIQKSVQMTDEDLKSLVDIAERRYVNNINLTSQAPVIQVTGQNTGNTQADRMNLANTLRDILVQQVASGSVQTTAKAF